MAFSAARHRVCLFVCLLVCFVCLFCLFVLFCVFSLSTPVSSSPSLVKFHLKKKKL